MRKLVKQYRLLLILIISFVVIGGILGILYSKGDILRWVNTHYSPELNFFFKYATWFGGGEMVPIVIILTLFISFRMFAVLGAANVLTFILSQFFKRIVFSSIPRPKLFFEDLGEILNAVDGVALHSYFSFPSGHAASAFALFIGLALFARHKWVSVFCFVFAVIVAFSRVYLTQHFFIDIYAGGTLGTVTVLFIYYYFSTREWYEKDWAKKPFIIGWNWKHK